MSDMVDSELAQLQADFTGTLFDEDNARLRAHLPPGLPEAEAAGLIDIYRNNLIASLIEALRAAFPVCEQFVGKAFFSKLGRVFLLSYPPEKPRLSAWGGAFPAFLAGFPPAQQAPALPELAAFEWAQQVAWFADDLPPVIGADLQELDADALMALPLGLHPSASILADPHFDVQTIWERHQHSPVSLADLPDPPPGIVIWRKGLDVVYRHLDAAETAFLAACDSPAPLGDIAARSGLEAMALQSALATILPDGLLKTHDTGETG